MHEGENQKDNILAHTNMCTHTSSNIDKYVHTHILLNIHCEIEITHTYTYIGERVYIHVYAYIYTDMRFIYVCRSVHVCTGNTIFHKVTPASDRQ